MTFSRRKKGMKNSPVFLSFIEEGVMNPQFEDYVGGRIEIYRKGPYADEEIRFFTKDQKRFETFRKSLDFEYVTELGLKILRRFIIKYFQDYSEIKT